MNCRQFAAHLLRWDFTHMFRFETAGESHGECLLATLTGLPAGIPISLDAINHELWRRQQGFGRGGRMKIETDRAEIVTGVRHGRTIGSPIGMIIRNSDWKNWTESLAGRERRSRKAQTRHASPPRPCRPGRRDQVQLPRGPLYSGTRQRPRDRRAGRRRRSLQSLPGPIRRRGPEPRRSRSAPQRMERTASWDEIVELSRRTEVVLGCVDPAEEVKMKAVVDEVYRTGDTVGGIFEVVAHGLPVGLGSHITWDSRLDGKLAQAIVSMQAVKGVEIGEAEAGSAKSLVRKCRTPFTTEGRAPFLPRG